jgi:hypothetical protein
LSLFKSFQTFNPFKLFPPPSLSSPAPRGKMKKGVEPNEAIEQLEGFEFSRSRKDKSVESAKDKDKE